MDIVKAVEWMRENFIKGTTPGDYPLPYRLYVPKDYTTDKKYPVLLFLHGAGERGDDNECQILNGLPAMFCDEKSPVYGAIVIAPQCPADCQWVNTPWANGSHDKDAIPQSRELTAVLLAVEDIFEKYSCDRSRFYVAGLSMGGYGTWDVVTRHPEMVAAAVPICGGGDPSKAALIADIPIRAFHGGIDDTVPVSGTRDMAEALTDAGAADFVYKEWNGMGHAVWNESLSEDYLAGWLFSQKKG
jgi:predicted peptidase